MSKSKFLNCYQANKLISALRSLSFKITMIHIKALHLKFLSLTCKLYQQGLLEALSQDMLHKALHNQFFPLLGFSRHHHMLEQEQV